MPFGYDAVLVACPWCGESVELYVDPQTEGTMIEDCEICCRPWRVDVSVEDGEMSVDVQRG